MITSGRSRATAASPVVPSMAVLTSYLRAVRLIRSARRIDGSSSTTSTRVMTPRRARTCRRSPTGSVIRTVSPPPGVSQGHDAPAHGLSEALGHGEAEARRPGSDRRTPGERLEDAFLLLVRHARAVVHHLEHAPSSSSQLRLQLRRRRRPGSAAARWRTGWPAPARAGRDRPGPAGRSSGTDHLEPQAVVQPAQARPGLPRRSPSGAGRAAAIPVCRRLMSSRLPISASEPVGVLLDGGEQIGLIARRPVPRRSAAGCCTLALIEASGRTQVVADGGGAARSASGCLRPAPRPGRPGSAAGPGQGPRPPARRSRQAARWWPWPPAR